MMSGRSASGLRALLLAVVIAGGGVAQDGPPPPPDGGGFGPGGSGGGPPGMGADRAIVEEYDKNKNGRLDKDERTAARARLREEKEARRRDGGDEPGRMPGPPRENREPPKAGITLKPADVKAVPESVPLYDASVLRTLFFQFEDADWEAALEDFTNTDAEIPATLVVDGKSYPGVGVSFRGASSLFSVGTGYKRSLNVSIDAA